jgi:fimbrial chaperone protein
MRSMLMKRLPRGPAAVLVLLSGPALASVETVGGGVSLSQTRVVYLATDKAQLLTVKNTGQQRYLIQSRVLRSPDDASSAPFLVSPPLFTLQPNSRQLLRIVPQGDVLPADRESVFTLSVLAIPAQAEPNTTASTRVSMGIRFGLKLFYRPAGLKERAEGLSCDLQVSTAPGGIRIDNPTPYYQTFGQLALDGLPVKLDARSSMLAPHSAQHYSATGRVIQANWQTLTDEGGLSAPCVQLVSSTQEKS